ncbi:MAG: glycosyltransferase family 4 protein [Vicinamibacteria bacterium]
MVTPHLPPDLAANALLPELLGEGLLARGHEVSYVALTPRQAGADSKPGVVYIRRPRSGAARRLRLSQLVTVGEVLRKATGPISRADVVHVHSNTLMNQVSAAIARSRGRPFILTHYGTEIWHYRRKRFFDPFLWMNRHAAHVTYYSRLLLERSLDLGVAPKEYSVVYPPVDRRFRVLDSEARARARVSLGVDAGPLLINVKRLHPLAGQRYLVEAMSEIRERCPNARLWIAGEGESRAELAALVERLGLGAAVRLLGGVDHRELPRYYAAADLFVLPSILEAFPTVAAESLACGTPVVTAANPGGSELKELFPKDVSVVPLQNASALASSILAVLASPKRTSEETLRLIEQELRPESALDKYLALYDEATARG